MNVAIYARVSTDMQAEQGYSLGAQVADCTAKAKELGATIIKEYVDDGYSGAYLERPALQAMREALRQKMYQAIVCYDVDRLSRNLSHQLLITEDIEKSGAKLVFVKSDYQNTAEGKLFYAMKGAFGVYEREKFRERSMRGRLEMLRKGMVIEDSHVYGYDFDKENHCYVINPIEAENVKAIYKLYLNHFGGVPTITKYLNEHIDEYPPIKQAWSFSIVHDILHREMYTGKFYSNRIYHYRTGLKTEKKVIRPKEEWVEMTCPAIISREDYEEAKKIAGRNRSFDYHQRKKPFLLQGMLYCGQCGKMINVTRGSKNTPRYVCHRGTNHGWSRGCGAKSMICKAVDEAFWQLLVSICKSPAKLKAYVEVSMPTADNKEAVESKKRQAKLEKIKAERKSVMTWFSKQLLTHDEATERLEAIKKAETKLLKENVPSPSQSPQMDYQKACEAVMNCDVSTESRRNIVLKLIDRVEIMRTDNAVGIKNYKLSINIHFK
jgi:site-specific DNA recombinase